MTKPLRTILLVGHCGADSYGLAQLVKAAAPNSEAVRVNTDRALRDQLDGAALLLVNRVLDGRFAASTGVELIRGLRAEGFATPMMLVSNYPDAQSDAVKAGAVHGFGKRELAVPSALQRLREALAVKEP